jgi:hypothetical protein
MAQTYRSSGHQKHQKGSRTCFSRGSIDDNGTSGKTIATEAPILPCERCGGSSSPEVVLPGGCAMKSRLTRLAYTLASLAALAAALGAGQRWH